MTRNAKQLHHRRVEWSGTSCDSNDDDANIIDRSYE